MPSVIVMGGIMLSCRQEMMSDGAIYECDQYTVTTDSVTGGIYSAQQLYAWRTDSLIPEYPRYSSDHLLPDAVYNMALHQMAVNGSNVYTSTRDVSFAVYMSLAAFDPEMAKSLLRGCVSDGRIVQDEVDGYGWPVVTDRMVWAVAAWEVYKVTGDREWLTEAYEVTDRTLRESIPVVYNEAFSLVRGEMSSATIPSGTLYPRWADATDRYESMSLAANVIYARAFTIAAWMASELGTVNHEYQRMARRMLSAINDYLWIPNYGYYSEYLYGGVYPIQSHITDNLGQALGILFDVATPEMAASIMTKTPRTVYATPVVFPIGNGSGGSAPVETHRIDACVQSLWNMAALRAGHAESLAMGLGAIYRDAMSTPMDEWGGDGVAAITATTLRVTFGMEFTTQGIEFHPMVLPPFTGEKRLTGFNYRGATLDIILRGTGTVIAGFSIDGQPSAKYIVPSDIEGHHKIEIILANNSMERKAVAVMDYVPAPPLPVVDWLTDHHARIADFNVGTNLFVYLNGVFQEEVNVPDYEFYNAPEYTVICFASVADNRWIGLCARPRQYFPPGSLTDIPAESFARGGTRLIADRKMAKGFVEISRTKYPRLRFEINADTDGDYLLTLRYANGSVSLHGKGITLMRRLKVNGEAAGVFVLPFRGKERWGDTGFSNTLRVYLHEGVNRISIDLDPTADGFVNDPSGKALIDYIRVIKAAKESI